MKRKALMISGSIVLVCMVAATIYAQGVLKPSQKSPEQVVAARKFAMGAMGADAGDLREKIKAGNIQGVAANAGSIAALATFLPLVYQETYTQVYPVKGSKFFFKEAPLANMEAASENLKIQAQELMKLASANDKSGVNAQVEKLFGACGGCHKAYRGKY
jgi:hypothetical protein